MNPKRAIPPLTLLAIIGLGVFTSCSAPSETSRSPVSQRSNSSLPDVIYNDVNQLRAEHGSRAIRRHAGLDKLASDHCEFLRQNRGTFSLYGKNVSHHGSEGRAVAAIKGLDMISCSENVAWTQTGPNHGATSQALIKLWRNSSKHRDAMLQDEWTHTGVGVVIDTDGSVFATQIFGTKNLSHMIMRERLSQF